MQPSSSSRLSTTTFSSTTSTLPPASQPQPRGQSKIKLRPRSSQGPRFSSHRSSRTFHPRKNTKHSKTTTTTSSSSASTRTQGSTAESSTAPSLLEDWYNYPGYHTNPVRVRACAPGSSVDLNMNMTTNIARAHAYAYRSPVGSTRTFVEAPYGAQRRRTKTCPSSTGSSNPGKDAKTGFAGPASVRRRTVCYSVRRSVERFGRGFRVLRRVLFCSMVGSGSGGRRTSLNPPTTANAYENAHTSTSSRTTAKADDSDLQPSGTVTPKRKGTRRDRSRPRKSQLESEMYCARAMLRDEMIFGDEEVRRSYWGAFEGLAGAAGAGAGAGQGSRGSRAVAGNAC